MTEKRRVSLFFKLIWRFVFFTAVPLALVVTLTILILTTSLNQMSVAKNTDIINAVFREIESLLMTVEQDISEVDFLRREVTLESDLTQEILEKLVASRSELDMIQLIDASSRVTAVAPFDETLLGIDLSRHNFVIEAADLDKVSWSQTFLSPNSGLPTISAILPTPDGGVVFYLNLNSLSESVISDNLRTFGYSYIMDRDGTFIAHPQPELVLRRENERHIPAVMDMIRHPTDGVTVEKDSDDILMIRQIPLTGWILGFRQPRSEVFPLIRVYRAVSISGAILALLAAVFAAFYGVRSALAPLRSVINGITSVSTGDYSFETPSHSSAEVADLADKFKVMVAAIKQREEALETMNTNLDNLVKERTGELQEAHEQLLAKERMAELGGLVAGLAHEINTPLGTAYMAVTHLEDQLSVLDDDAGIDEYADCLDTAAEAVKIAVGNLKKAADQVQSFKQVAVDRTNEERRRFEVGSYVEEVLIVLKPYFRKRNVSVNVDCPVELFIDSYPGPFGQILNNLILNSLTHGFPANGDGAISIRLRMNEQLLFIDFSDDGEGMENDVKEKVFRPFFTTRRPEGGTGLGLHIVYNLVTQVFGGTIACESTPGKGTLFSISLPRIEP